MNSRELLPDWGKGEKKQRGQSHSKYSQEYKALQDDSAVGAEGSRQLDHLPRAWSWPGLPTPKTGQVTLAGAGRPAYHWNDSKF